MKIATVRWTCAIPGEPPLVRRHRRGRRGCNVGEAYEKPPVIRGFRLAGVPGLEPRTTEPESAVLPITPYPNGQEQKPRADMQL